MCGRSSTGDKSRTCTCARRRRHPKVEAGLFSKLRNLFQVKGKIHHSRQDWESSLNIHSGFSNATSLMSQRARTTRNGLISSFEKYLRYEPADAPPLLSPHMQCLQPLLPAPRGGVTHRALYLPTFSHVLIVNKLLSQALPRPPFQFGSRGPKALVSENPCTTRPVPAALSG